MKAEMSGVESPSRLSRRLHLHILPHSNRVRLTTLSNSIRHMATVNLTHHFPWYHCLPFTRPPTRHQKAATAERPTRLPTLGLRRRLMVVADSYLRPSQAHTFSKRRLTPGRGIPMLRKGGLCLVLAQPETDDERYCSYVDFSFHDFMFRDGRPLLRNTQAH
jgi:hypothetical protein